MTKTVHGFIRGKTIQLTEEVGLPEGQEVEVLVTSVSPKPQWGEGLRRCAGALADQWTVADDRILERIQQDRARDSRQEAAE